jgi:DNA-binding NarL/FixJ family response regulator
MKNELNIILVDDNIQFRKTLKCLLEERFGYNIIAEASDGKEFLELANLYEADIVLMDLIMDVMDGFEAAKRATYRYKGINIIAITMHIETVFLRKLIESGFNGCIYKSNLFTEIDKAIKSVMNKNLYYPKEIKF